MNTSKQPNRRPIIWIYLIFLALMIVGAVLISTLSKRNTAVSYSDYLDVRGSGTMTVAEIHQNEATPTGYIIYMVRNDETVYKVFVSDVNEE